MDYKQRINNTVKLSIYELEGKLSSTILKLQEYLQQYGDSTEVYVDNNYDGYGYPKLELVYPESDEQMNKRIKELEEFEKQMNDKKDKQDRATYERLKQKFEGVK